MKIGQVLKSYLSTLKPGDDLMINRTDYATRKVKILAISGKGKTYTASKVAEELIIQFDEEQIKTTLENGEEVPILILDPVGHYWGLKEKFPILVFGVENDKVKNRHADYYLTDDSVEEQAELLAMFVATTKTSVIIDLKGWTDSRQQKFGGIFADVLYHNNKHRRHVFIEEADVFIPQQVQFPDEIRCRHAMDVLVRRGRSEGLGCTIVTQRPAIVYKNVLTQADLSIVLNLADPTDIEPVDKMVKRDRDLSDDDKKEILDRITKLQKGEAFVYSPSWLGVKAFVKIYPKIAYHSGATRGEPDYRDEDEVLSIAKPVDLPAVLSKLEELKSVKAQEEEEKASKTKEKINKIKPSSVAIATPKVDVENIRAEVAKEYEAKLKEVYEYESRLNGTILNLKKEIEQLKRYQRFGDALVEFITPTLNDQGTRILTAADAMIRTEKLDLVIKEERKTVSLSDKDNLGRIAILVAEGFFSKEGKSKKDVVKELQRLYKVGDSGTVYKSIQNALDDLSTPTYGYLRLDGSVYVSTGKMPKREEVAA